MQTDGQRALGDWVLAQISEHVTDVHVLDAWTITAMKKLRAVPCVH